MKNGSSVKIVEKVIDAGGVKTRCLEAGSGFPMVLLHGAALGVDSFNTWFRVLSALSDRFRVITFDQIGFGETDMPENGVYQGRLERVDHALAVLQELEIEQAALVGHSEGGFMAARIAIVKPELVSSLVIITSGGTAPYLGNGRDESWIKVAEANYNDPALFDDEDSYIRISRGLCFSVHEEYEEMLRASYRRARETGHMDLFKNMPKVDSDYRAREKLQRDYIFPYLGSLELPVLLVWAADDPGVIVERGSKLLELIPQGEMHVFGQSAHNVMHDRADDFNHLLGSWCLRHYSVD